MWLTKSLVWALSKDKTNHEIRAIYPVFPSSAPTLNSVTADFVLEFLPSRTGGGKRGRDTAIGMPWTEDKLQLNLLTQAEHTRS